MQAWLSAKAGERNSLDDVKIWGPIKPNLKELTNLVMERMEEKVVVVSSEDEQVQKKDKGKERERKPKKDRKDKGGKKEKKEKKDKKGKSKDL